MAAKARPGGKLFDLPLDAISPCADQPRKRFDEDGLKELTESIHQMGVLEPILVTQGPDSTYEILAGERRWRAADMAGLKSIPALVLDLPEQARPLVPLVENLVREDLPAMDTARALDRLARVTKLGPAAVASSLGLTPRTVYRYLGLLKLPPEVREMVEAGALNATQAFELVSIADDREGCIEVARLGAAYGIAARKLSQMVQRQEREKARASFASHVVQGPTPKGDGRERWSWGAAPQDESQAWDGESADLDAKSKKSREHILTEARAVGGSVEWAESVEAFDTRICHGSCGQWRYPSVCGACPGLAFVAMITRRRGQAVGVGVANSDCVDTSTDIGLRTRQA